MPAATPVTTPVVLTVAVATSLLLHVSDAGLDARVVVLPTHIDRLPVIEPGAACTVMLPVRRQPVGNVYVTVAAPAATPFTSPVEPPIVATVAGVIVHNPPAAVSVSVADAPTHTDVLPVIGPGSGLTDTSFVA